MADEAEISAFEASVNARINESAAALSEWLRPSEAAAHRCVADALDDRSLTTAEAHAKGDACTARVSGARARFADEMQGFQRKLHACHGDTASARVAAGAAGRSGGAAPRAVAQGWGCRRHPLFARAAAPARRLAGRGAEERLQGQDGSGRGRACRQVHATFAAVRGRAPRRAARRLGPRQRRRRRQRRKEEEGLVQLRRRLRWRPGHWSSARRLAAAIVHRMPSRASQPESAALAAVRPPHVLMENL